jgi:predicted HicB family RNase H-like nuclease
MKEGEIMTISRAQQKATAKYVSKAYDRIEVKVQKGAKDKIKSHAEQQGESLNGFVGRAIDETIERDTTKGAK